jgi:adenylate cyclase
MGIGLNTGTVVSGNVGSHRRLEYTAIGDTTNTASRLDR